MLVCRSSQRSTFSFLLSAYFSSRSLPFGPEESHAAISDVTQLPKEAVWVVFEEVDPPDWYVGGKPGERMAKK